MDEKLIEDLTRWLLEEIKNNPYADIGYTVTVHEGRVTRIQKHISVKLKNDKCQEKICNAVGESDVT